MLECAVDLKTFKDLGGETWKIRRFVDPNIKEWSAFNPSIGQNPDGSLIGLFRSSNYLYDSVSGSLTITQGAGVKNKLYFSELNHDFTPIQLHQVEILGGSFPLVRGVEDAKLYYKNNCWYFTGVVQEPGYIPKPRMAIFKLVSSTSAEMLDIFDITNRPVEKNWMVSYSNREFDFIYDSTSIVMNGQIIQVREPLEAVDELRGGPNLVELADGTYLSVLHHTEYVKSGYYMDSRTFSYKQGIHRKYTHRFALYSKNGVLLRISKEFCFNAKEIEFACGLLIKNEHAYISYGRKDLESWVAKIELKLILDMLEDI